MPRLATICLGVAAPVGLPEATLSVGSTDPLAPPPVEITGIAARVVNLAVGTGPSGGARARSWW